MQFLHRGLVPVGQGADTPPAAVRADLGEAGRVAIRHGLVVAVLERPETGAQLQPELRLRRLYRSRAACTLGSPSTPGAWLPELLVLRVAPDWRMTKWYADALSLWQPAFR